MSANRISDALAVHVGDTLMIPSGYDVLSKRSAESFQADIIYYKLKDGDTLMRIAAQFGVPVESLYKANKLRPDTVLTPGKVIRVVKSTGM
jgi:LysM repeat protein